MKYWEIREGGDSSRFDRRGYRSGMRGYKEDREEEAYKCGYEDGYREAMKEAEHYYGEKGMRKGGYRED